jgi:quercetin dioxygenase-like cupin family protein
MRQWPVASDASLNPGPAVGAIEECQRCQIRVRAIDSGAHAVAQRAYFGEPGPDRLTFFNPIDEPAPEVVFPGADHQRIMRVPQNIRETVDLNRWYEGRFFARALVNVAGDEPMSVIQVDYPPNAHIPAHTHDAPQVVVVIRGSIFQGRREIKAGNGYYTPANVRYAVTSGPEGVSVLEVRRCTLGEYDTTWMEENPDRWT